MAEATTKSLRVPATYQDVRIIDQFMVDFLQRAGNVDEAVIQNVELAVHEMCCNILEHAYAEQPGGQIGIKVVLATHVRRELLIELFDTGQVFDSSSVAPVDLESPQEGGYGMFLIDTLMDEVHYERRAGQNVWQLKKIL